MQLLIDIGNSRIKCGLFVGHSRQSTLTLETTDELELQLFIANQPITAGMYAASGELPEWLSDMLNDVDFPMSALHHQTPLPFANHYRTPETLGLDRLANMAAVQQLFPGENSLVIDAGTCVTFDLLEKGTDYRGGIISPGLSMRARAMHAFTARLPLIEPGETDLLGTSTARAMRSGVFNGWTNEVHGIINQLSDRFKPLKVIVTGGDASALQGHVENGIFARPYLQLEGLNELLLYQLNQG